MLFESRARPIALTLGAAAVLAIGGVAVPLTALASDSGTTAGTTGTTDDPSASPTPDPGGSETGGTTESPTPTPTDSTPTASPPPTDPPPSEPPPPTSGGDGGSPAPAPSLTIAMSLSSKTAAPGGSVVATVGVSSQDATAHNAVLRLSASGASVLSPGGIGDLGSTSRLVASVVTIPTTRSPGTVKVTASISADGATTRSTSQTIDVTTAAAAVAATTGLGASVGAGALPLNAPGSSLPGAPMAIPGAVQPQLPMIGQPPAVAPKLGQPGTPTVLRAASSALGMDDTTFRLVLTQVAWLSALLVFMSMLLTQLRLKRRRRLRLAGRTR